ncbi:MAG: hypothetical protein SZ59_C0001G0037 [candidate division TM6 bacterium GW2011_GWF2_28_16]|jgi:hypothetical protein|nr:MAG: hypothetical protein SZ59_C0001G0037 [candidate division TM6 bacterium GW2011_GWF2_28_16]
MFFLNILFFLPSCNKQKNNKLAQNYYKMALVELQDQRDLNNYSYKKALEYVNLALNLNTTPEYLALKATLLLELADENVALEFFDAALINTKDNKLKCEILNNKACLQAQIGMLSKNENLINSSILIWQDLTKNKDYLTPEVALYNISKVNAYNNNYINAKQNLEHAIKLAPNYLDAHYYLALINYNLSDFNAAKREIDSVLFLYPEHKNALQLKSLIQKI